MYDIYNAIKCQINIPCPAFRFRATVARPLHDLLDYKVLPHPALYVRVVGVPGAEGFDRARTGLPARARTA